MLAGYYRAEPAVHQYWSLYWQDTGEPCQRCTNTNPCVGGVLPSRASGAPILTLVYIAFCWSLGFVHPVDNFLLCSRQLRHLLALYLLYHVLFSPSAHYVLLSPCSMHVLSCYHVWMSHGRGAGEPGRDAHGCLRSESWYGSGRACAVCQILLTLILKLRVWNRNLWVHIKLSHGYGHFSLSLGKTLPFSLNPTHLIRKSVNADNGHFWLVQSTDSYGKLTLLIRTLSCQLLQYGRGEKRGHSPALTPR